MGLENGERLPRPSVWRSHPWCAVGWGTAGTGMRTLKCAGCSSPVTADLLVQTGRRAALSAGTVASGTAGPPGDLWAAGGSEGDQ